MNDEDNESHAEPAKEFDNSLMDGINSFTNSSRTSSDDEIIKKKFFDTKLYLKTELDLLLKVFTIFFTIFFMIFRKRNMGAKLKKLRRFSYGYPKRKSRMKSKRRLWPRRRTS